MLRALQGSVSACLAPRLNKTPKKKQMLKIRKQPCADQGDLECSLIEINLSADTGLYKAGNSKRKRERERD